MVKNALAKCVLRDGGRQWQRCFTKCEERLSEANNSADRERFCMQILGSGSSQGFSKLLTALRGVLTGRW